MSSLSKPIVTALAAYGMSGEVFHAPCLHDHPGFFLKTILERSNNLSATHYPYTKTAKHFDDVLSDSEIELIIINTPNEQHFPMTKASLEAGKHVIVEKPFTISSQEGEELIQLAEQKGKILSIFHSKRYESDFLTVKKLLKEGHIGDPAELHWHYDRYRTNITHKKWKEENKPGAGVLYDLGVHMIDSVLELFGEPQQINCHTRILREGAGSPDYFHLILRYKEMDVYLHSSTIVLEKGPVITLHGTKGSFIKYFSDPQEEHLKKGLKPSNKEYGEEDPENYGLLTTIKEGKIEKIKYQSAKGNYSHYYDGIFNAIRNGSDIPVTAQQALRNIRTIENAILSNNLCKTIQT